MQLNRLSDIVHALSHRMAVFFENEAEKLLVGGGIKNKDPKFMNDVTIAIKEKIDSKLEHLFMTKKLSYDFFITSPPFKEIWCKQVVKNNPKMHKFTFKVGQAVVKMAF